jgi:hypothetical protein
VAKYLTFDSMAVKKDLGNQLNFGETIGMEDEIFTVCEETLSDINISRDKNP